MAFLPRLILSFLAMMAPATGLRATAIPGVTLDALQLQSPNLRIEFDATMRSRIIARFGGEDRALGPFTASESVRGAKRAWEDFPVVSHQRERITDGLGTGERLVLRGTSAILTKQLTVTIYDAFPTLAVFEVEYRNTGKVGLQVKGWSNNAYTLEAKAPAEGPTFWSFQSGSYENRRDWLLPLRAGFQQDNFLGMNDTDYGGGTPIVDVWTQEAGLAVGHIETSPKLISLPVASADASHARVSVTSTAAMTLKPGASFRTFSHGSRSPASSAGASGVTPESARRPATTETRSGRSRSTGTAVSNWNVENAARPPPPPGAFPESVTGRLAWPAFAIALQMAATGHSGNERARATRPSPRFDAEGLPFPAAGSRSVRRLAAPVDASTTRLPETTAFSSARPGGIAVL